MITKYLHIYFANSYRTEMLKFKILPTLACKENAFFPIFKLGVQCCSNSLHQIGMFIIVPSRDESAISRKNVQKIEF